MEELSPRYHVLPWFLYLERGLWRLPAHLTAGLILLYLLVLRVGPGGLEHWLDAGGRPGHGLGMLLVRLVGHV